LFNFSSISAVFCAFIFLPHARSNTDNLRCIMKRLLVGLFLLATFVNAYSVEPSSAKLPIISLPVRVHLV